MQVLIRWFKVIGVLIALSLAVNCYAANNNSDLPAALEKNLKANLPDLIVDRVIATPVPGVYEVDSGRKVIYVDTRGNYAFVGNLLDLTNKDNLTAIRTEKLNKIDFTQLHTNIAIRKIIGNPQDKIAIFTDPDCPFCRRLEEETIPKLKNVTVYYFFFPLSLHADSATVAKRILCSENPESAMTAYMLHDAAITRNDKCNNAAKLAQMQNDGNDLVQVTGTPTIVLPNGKIVSGFMQADALSQLINNNKAESAPVSVLKKT